MNIITKTTLTFSDCTEYAYDFSELDQKGNYMKVGSLLISSDRKAINRARKILNEPKANILIKEEV